MLLAFCISLTVAMQVESEGWNLFVMIGSSVLINPLMAGLSQIPDIAAPLAQQRHRLGLAGAERSWRAQVLLSLALAHLHRLAAPAQAGLLSEHAAAPACAGPACARWPCWPAWPSTPRLAHSPLDAAVLPPAADRLASGLAGCCWLWPLHLVRMPLFFVHGRLLRCLRTALQRRGMAGLDAEPRAPGAGAAAGAGVPLAPPAAMSSMVLMHAALSACSIRRRILLLAAPARIATEELADACRPAPAILWFLYYLLLFAVLLWAARLLLPPSAKAGCARCRCAPGPWACRCCWRRRWPRSARRTRRPSRCCRSSGR